MSQFHSPVEELFGDSYGAIESEDDEALAVFMENLETRMGELNDASDAVVEKVTYTVNELVPENEQMEEAAYRVLQAAGYQLETEIPEWETFQTMDPEAQQELLAEVTTDAEMEQLEVDAEMDVITEKEDIFSDRGDRLDRTLQNLIRANAYRTFYRGLLAELLTGDVSVQEARLRAELIDSWWTDKRPQLDRPLVLLQQLDTSDMT